ncbi:MAG: membrane-anchored protein [Pararhizobium sp.]
MTNVSKWLTQTRQRLHRSLKYRLNRPLPPACTHVFKGPVVVVGSAPVIHRPEGWSADFSVITINGSQSAIRAWGVDVPDVSFMMFNQVEGTNTNAVEVRRVLSGQRVRSLYVLLWRKNARQRLVDGLKAFGYGYDDLVIVDRYERMSLLEHMTGRRNTEVRTEDKCSNGLNAVLFALYHGAPQVIITGINPNSTGHSYNQTGLARAHVQMDKTIIEQLLAEGRPLFTADPQVSRDLKIPLWTGETAARASART